MSLRAYSYRLGTVVDLLDEREWAEIAVLLANRIDGIKAHLRENRGCSVEDLVRAEPTGQRALDTYQELTGTRLTSPDDLWHVRMKDYGSLCPQCSKPFRTPTAKICAECGFVLPDGALAGELSARCH
ncbi:MAG: hypothetical protein AAGE18_11015 [Pseudomonadota bacterium]